MLRKIAWIFAALILVVVGYVGFSLLTTRSHSPAAVAEFKEGDFLIQVNYCQPFKKGRLIFGTEAEGALVPFGKKWRTGANDATEINFSHDVLINGNTLKAGRYSLYTIPEAAAWTVVFNNKLGYWGRGFNDVFDESMDALRVKATVRNDMPEIEQFTISFTPSDSLVNMNFYWSNTRATVTMQKAL